MYAHRAMGTLPFPLFWLPVRSGTGRAMAAMKANWKNVIKRPVMCELGGGSRDADVGHTTVRFAPACCCQRLFLHSSERWQCCYKPDDAFQREHLRVD